MSRCIPTMVEVWCFFQKVNNYLGYVLHYLCNSWFSFYSCNKPKENPFSFIYPHLFISASPNIIMLILEVFVIWTAFCNVNITKIVGACPCKYINNINIKVRQCKSVLFHAKPAKYLTQFLIFIQGSDLPCQKWNGNTYPVQYLWAHLAKSGYRSLNFLNTKMIYRRKALFISLKSDLYTNILLSLGKYVDKGIWWLSTLNN